MIVLPNERYFGGRRPTRERTSAKQSWLTHHEPASFSTISCLRKLSLFY
ncbi:hypothetical protein HMPREF3226_02399 [Prevotella corporis]|uniref:Uncharacterized protein n=1 Tax=Prevotella corporis TaxID=28128 RepID=A0A133PVU0_9BACT|nr:hypothetical protein HMPREF3226_02399 [Prevotella corporis]